MRLESHCLGCISLGIKCLWVCLCLKYALLKCHSPKWDKNYPSGNTSRNLLTTKWQLAANKTWRKENRTGTCWEGAGCWRGGDRKGRIQDYACGWHCLRKGCTSQIRDQVNCIWSWGWWVVPKTQVLKGKWHVQIGKCPSVSDLGNESVAFHMSTWSCFEGEKREFWLT